MVQMRKVDSTVIYSIGYDESTNELYIRFMEGKLYKYFMVPKYKFTNFLIASSKGHYFHSEIRDTYSYRQIYNYQ